MRNSQNRYFYHIFVFPGDAPGAITLNVVWMERERDAYKLSRFMCPSNYNRFWDRVRYLWKNRHYIIPFLHSTPPLGGFSSEYRHALWYGKTRMVSLPDGEKVSKILYSFWRDPRTWRTDGRRVIFCGDFCQCFIYLFIFLWPPYSPALVNGGSLKFYTW